MLAPSRVEENCLDARRSHGYSRASTRLVWNEVSRSLRIICQTVCADDVRFARRTHPVEKVGFLLRPSHVILIVTLIRVHAQSISNRHASLNPFLASLSMCRPHQLVAESLAAVTTQAA